MLCCRRCLFTSVLQQLECALQGMQLLQLLPNKNTAMLNPKRMLCCAALPYHQACLPLGCPALLQQQLCPCQLFRELKILDQAAGRQAGRQAGISLGMYAGREAHVLLSHCPFASWAALLVCWPTLHHAHRASRMGKSEHLCMQLIHYTAARALQLR